MPFVVTLCDTIQCRTPCAHPSSRPQRLELTLVAACGFSVHIRSVAGPGRAVGVVASTRFRHGSRSMQMTSIQFDSRASDWPLCIDRGRLVACSVIDSQSAMYVRPSSWLVTRRGRLCQMETQSPKYCTGNVAMGGRYDPRRSPSRGLQHGVESQIAGGDDERRTRSGETRSEAGALAFRRRAEDTRLEQGSASRFSETCWR